jgi:hypothetical protein
VTRVFTCERFAYFQNCFGNMSRLCEGNFFSFKCFREQHSVQPCTHFLIPLNFWWFIKRRDRAASSFASSKVNFIFDGCEPRLNYFNTFQCEPLIPKFIEFRSVVSNKQSPHNKRELTRATPMFNGAQLCNS